MTTPPKPVMSIRLTRDSEGTVLMLCTYAGEQP
jgi:hypothetical protein